MKAVAFTLAAMAASSSAVQAQTPGDIRDLVGARAAGAETAMQARGYMFVKTRTGDDRKYSYWWNTRTRQCVTVATMDGRYDSITTSPAPDCNQRASAPEYRDRGFQQPDARRESPSYAGERGPVQVSGNAVDLGLVCFGDGQRPGVATTYGWSWNSKRDRYDYGNRTEMTSQQFDASVMIQMWDGGGRISLPKKLIPPVHSRGSEGWWDLYDVEAGPDLIRAKYRLNGMNKPTITINRRSGQITIRGLDPYGFRGTCDLIDGDDHRRF
ncbi:MAG: hypothetical protein V4461_13355 [Pseudomonadota bacterium]